MVFITQQQHFFFFFLATIGGNLGLCLGCSLITIIEFAVFGLDYLITRKKQHETQPNNDRTPRQNSVVI